MWLSAGRMLRGHALTLRGESAAGMMQIRQGLADYRATGAQVQAPYGLGLLAEGCVGLGQTEEGLAILAEALALVDKTWVRKEEAELYRLKGEFCCNGHLPMRLTPKPAFTKL